MGLVVDLFAGPSVDLRSQRCSRCGEVKHLTEFHRNRRRHNGRDTYCKPCRAEYRREWYLRNRQQAIDDAARWKRENPDKRREYDRRSRYGLEPEDFAALVAEQDGRCAICGVVEDPLKVDHCHNGGHVRGLLCDRCNRGIGYFDDDPAVLRAAAEYVEDRDG